MSDITEYRFPLGTVQVPVRMFPEDGDAWFVAQDVCRVLELSHVGSALRILDPDEKGVRIMHTPGGDQEISVISEPGLYKLIGRSRKPAAKVFDRWVRHDVLPQIRRTGAYVSEDILNDPKWLRASLIEYTERVEKAEAALAIAAPKAQAYDDHLSSEGQHSVGEAARCLGITPTKAFDWLRSNEWMDKRHNRGNEPRAWVVDRGWMTVRPIQIPTGGTRFQPLFTNTGVEAFFHAVRRSDLFVHDIPAHRLLSSGGAQ